MNASGHPSKPPIKLTTLSRLSIAAIPTRASRKTRDDAIIFLVGRWAMCFPQVVSRTVPSDRVAISNDGKFCNGNVKTTAKLYASCTVDAKTPEGSDVVITVLTSSPNDTQQHMPKMQ